MAKKPAKKVSKAAKKPAAKKSAAPRAKAAKAVAVRKAPAAVKAAAPACCCTQGAAERYELLGRLVFRAPFRVVR